MGGRATGEPVRIGVVGVGSQGRFYARLVSSDRCPSVRLTALCSPNPHSPSRSAHAAFATELAVPLFTDYAALLHSGLVDAVVIATPHYEHPAMGIEAIRAGIHVLVEKPAGVYTKQVKELFAVAAAHPEVTVAIMFNHRANPLYADLKAAIDSAELGSLRHTSWVLTHWWRPDAYYASSPWRATWGGEGGGVLVNQAAHQLDLWQWLCGTPIRCFARVQFGFRRDIPVDDEVEASVQFAKGATGSFLTCTNDLVGTDRLEMLFDRAKVVVDDSSRVTIWRFVDDEREIARAVSPEDAARIPSETFDRTRFYHATTREYSSQWGVQHSLVIENFGSHILDGTPLIAPGEEGMNSVLLANAMLLSAWMGTDVDLTAFDEDRYLAELNKRIAAEGKYPLRT